MSTGRWGGEPERRGGGSRPVVPREGQIVSSEATGTEEEIRRTVGATF